MRIALGIEYDGSQYHGWQAQNGLYTVQQVVERAIAKVADDELSIVCAGRTDTGVHAFNQVIHFDTDKERTIRAWIYGTNSFLPKDVCVRWAKDMEEGFHARYSAISRSYRYIIFNSPIRPALYRVNMTWQYRQLNHEEMHRAAQHLVGEHDFTSFRSVECQSKTPMRNIHAISVKRQGDFVIIDVTANAFLHHMVRNIVGVLMAVGSGKEQSHWVEEVLTAKDRRRGAETAPAYGLYLVDVAYPDEFAIPKGNNGPLFNLDG
ncbi:MAG: tRNA pseudouridine(38-40) synthase TruA [Legionellaceae bacterium]|nr:tRNA pseudouridine(38-40) synthase TruA [Legionellaceae bacterium]